MMKLTLGDMRLTDKEKWAIVRAEPRVLGGSLRNAQVRKAAFAIYHALWERCRDKTADYSIPAIMRDLESALVSALGPRPETTDATQPP